MLRASIRRSPRPIRTLDLNGRHGLDQLGGGACVQTELVDNVQRDQMLSHADLGG